MQRRLWNEEEDSALRQFVKEHGHQKWTQIALLMQSRFARFDRNGKQCRERWFNHLEDSLMKGSWSVEDQEEFIRLHSEHGNKWSQISKRMEGRAENSVKNYFYSSLRRAVRLINKHFEENHLRDFTIKMSFMNKAIAQLGDSGSPTAKNLIQLILRLTVRRPKCETVSAGPADIYEEIINTCRALRAKRRPSSPPVPQPVSKPRPPQLEEPARRSSFYRFSELKSSESMASDSTVEKGGEQLQRWGGFQPQRFILVNLVEFQSLSKRNLQQ